MQYIPVISNHFSEWAKAQQSSKDSIIIPVLNCVCVDLDVRASALEVTDQRCWVPLKVELQLWATNMGARTHTLVFCKNSGALNHWATPKSKKFSILSYWLSVCDGLCQLSVSEHLESPGTWASRPVLLNLWVPICRSTSVPTNIYITIHSTSKVTVLKEQQN